MRTPRAAIAMLAAVLLAGCGGSEPPAHTVGVVLDIGGLGDRSFNDAAYAGLGRCVVRDDVTPRALQAAREPDYGPMLRSLVAAHDDAIVAIGFLMQNDLASAARQNPQTRFALIDGVVDARNVTSVTFREEEGSFLAGAVAAATSRTHRIAFVGGMDMPLLRKFEVGFTAGARQADPRVAVDVRYLNSFTDLVAGTRAAKALFDGGVDVVFAAAGAGGLGVISEAKRRGRWAIGVDADQDGLAPRTVLTSMRKRVDVAVEHICGDVAANRPRGGHLVLGLAQDGVGLTDFRYTRDIVGAATLKKVEALRQAVLSGRIVVPATRDELAAFKPAML